MEDWYLFNIEVNRTINIFPHLQTPEVLSESVIRAELLVEEAEDKIVYFGAPIHYLGKLFFI